MLVTKPPRRRGASEVKSKVIRAKNKCFILPNEEMCAARPFRVWTSSQKGVVDLLNALYHLQVGTAKLKPCFGVGSACFLFLPLSAVLEAPRYPHGLLRLP